jgi:hypothetical protein
VSQGSPASAKEYRIFSLLQTQFPGMAKSYRENITAISNTMDASPLGSMPSLHWYSDEAGRLFFRVNLDLPALFVLSEPVSRFQAYRQYVMRLDEERSYYADLALIPCYFGNFNRITCVDLYGSQAAKYFAPEARPLEGGHEVVWRLDPPSSTPAQFSSMNFVLKWASRDTEVSDTVRAVLSRYFQFSFWMTPKPGFTSNAHIIHSRDNISRIMKVAKSLYVVRKVGEPHPERISPYHTAIVQDVELGVVNRGGRFMTFSTYLAKDIVERLQSEADPSKGNLMINGLVYEFKDKVVRHSGSLSLLSVIADFLPTDHELFTSLVGLSATELFEENRETFGEIGTTEALRERIAERYRLYSPRIEFASTLLSKMDNPFDYLVDSLFPLLVRKDGRVYFVHPIILSALIKLGIEDVIDRSDSTTLVTFIQLLQKMRDQKPARLRFTDEAEHFSKMGVDFARLLPVLYSAFCGIRVSRLMSEFM